MMVFRRTLAGTIELSGIGLHSGSQCSVAVRPSDGRGYRFIFGRESFSAREAHFEGGGRGTVLHFSGGRTVRTVEHLLGALRGMGVDDVEIAVDGPEIPLMDGSALPFAKAVEAAGTILTDRPVTPLRISAPVCAGEGDGRSVIIMPSEQFVIGYMLQYDEPQIGTQYARLEISPETFLKEIAPARTFGLMSEVKMLRQHGLVKGGSLDNAVIVDSNRILARGGLRFPDEFVRHKILDIIGDLALLDRPLVGSVTAIKAGHAVHLRLVDLLSRFN